jgi:enoyl-CoA hydratase/carnithine racemase
MSDELIVHREGVVTRLTLNRPAKANALSATLVEALLEATLASFHDGTRLLVLDGKGAHFCAGFDFTDYARQSDGDLALRFIRIETLLQTLFHAPIETLALAHGRIFGAGADLVAACSRRVAAPNTSFRMPGLSFGLVLGARRLRDRIGEHAARNILGASRTFEAEEALGNGFVTRIAVQSEWAALLNASAREAQTLSPEALSNLGLALTSDTREADMAALVRSASAPGLGERIRVYRESK